MWGFFTPEQLTGLRQGVPEDPAEIRSKKRMEEIGQGECNDCNQDIVFNNLLMVWESEALIEYCPEAKLHKHKPKIRSEKP